MKIILELNQKLKKGYQVRIIEGPMDKTYDKEYLNIYKAGQYAQMALNEVNKAMGTSYELPGNLSITDEALQANKSIDAASAMMYKDVASGRHRLAKPAPQKQVDVSRIEVDGKEDVYLSARGVVLFAYSSWVDKRLPKAKLVLQKYCQLLASHGYGKGAKLILHQLERMNRDDGVKWIKDTYDQYIHDGTVIVDLMNSLQ